MDGKDGQIPMMNALHIICIVMVELYELGSLMRCMDKIIGGTSRSHV